MLEQHEVKPTAIVLWPGGVLRTSSGVRRQPAAGVSRQATPIVRSSVSGRHLLTLDAGVTVDQVLEYIGIR